MQEAARHLYIYWIAHCESNSWCYQWI